ncbi:MAG: hypothetical protein A2Z24_01270 [Candidatus Woykebacteria bacterium RBG_16_44_10]|uniref:Uncharacterized protein n=1 Tax=Candidatus Woykebacteria bacterium RBG_16_44_10 TaxID=1802597 RepID=A0A1G1WE68_9BACT|nr:MAG: hypothetical protein A2Z24_01270 [Candidatus Woykebacteria bacterium RBG_16_44_10]
MSVFYDHLVGLDDIHNEILEFDLPTRQHYHLLQIVDSTLHHEILNVILLEIPVEVHEHFLVEFNNRPHDPAHLDYLKLFSPEIEDKIRSRANLTKAKIIEELQRQR